MTHIGKVNWRRAGLVAMTGLLTAALAVVMLLLLRHGAGAHLLDSAVAKDPNSGNGATSAGGLSAVQTAVDSVRGPATIIMGSLSSLGVIAGGAMMAMGNRHGIQFMASSAGAGALVLIGNGIAA